MLPVSGGDMVAGARGRGGNANVVPWGPPFVGSQAKQNGGFEPGKMFVVPNGSARGAAIKTGHGEKPR